MAVMKRVIAIAAVLGSVLGLKVADNITTRRDCVIVIQDGDHMTEADSLWLEASDYEPVEDGGYWYDPDGIRFGWSQYEDSIIYSDICPGGNHYTTEVP